MKKCPNCNLYYDDSANVCSACNGALVDANAAPQAQPAQQYEAQPAQQYEAQPAPQAGTVLCAATDTTDTAGI